MISFFLNVLFCSFHYGQGNTALADSLLQTISEESSYELKLKTLLKVSAVYSRFDGEQTINYGKKAFKLAMASNDSSGMAKSCYSIGHGCSFIGNEEARLTYIQKGLNYAKRHKHIGEGYNLLGQYYSRKNMDSCLFYFNKYYAIAHAYDRPSLAFALHQMAYANNRLGNYSKADSLFKLSAKAIEVSEDKPLGAMIYYNKAITNYSRGKILDAVQDLKSSAAFAKEYKNVRLEVGVLHFLGLIATEQSDTTLALSYWEDAYELAMDKNFNTSLTGVVIRQLIVYHEEKGNTEIVIKLATELLALAEKTKVTVDHASALLYLSRINSQQGQKDLALSQLKLGLNDTADIPGNQEENYLLFKAANILIELKDFDASLSLTNRINDNLIEIGDESQQRDLADLYFRVYKNLGNHEKALTSLEKYSSLNNKWMSKVNHKQVLDLNKKYELEKKSDKISIQNTQLKVLREKEKVKNRNILLGLGSLLFIFSLIYYIRDRRFNKKWKRQQKTYTQHLLESREEEKRIISRELHDGIGQNLILLKNQLTPENTHSKKEVGEILEDLRSITRGLHPIVLEKFGLTAAIEQLINKLDNHTDIFISSEIENIDSFVSREHHIHLYRTIQEAFSNIIKHSDSPSAFITIRKEPSKIVVTIKDVGKGIHKNIGLSKNSLGLVTMQERVEIMGGLFKIKNNLPKGTCIEIELET